MKKKPTKFRQFPTESIQSNRVNATHTKCNLSI